MARRRRRHRMSGLSVNSAEAACVKFYGKDKRAVEVCKKTAGSLIRKIVANKPQVCKKFCGCR